MPPLKVPTGLEQLATRVVFFIAGFAISSWAPLVPLVQAKLGLDEGRLGALLLCLGLGSVVTMPFAGGLAARFGCRRAILAAGALICLSLPGMAAAPTTLLLALALLVFGAGLGTIDVVVNIQAVMVEKAAGRAMMSGFHGLYSVGGIVGAGLVTGLLDLKLSAFMAVLMVALLAALLLAGVTKGLLPYGGDEDAPPLAFPRGSVLLIGALCCITFLAEGAVLDWSGVLLSTVHGVETSKAGLGYVAFSLTMTLGRLTGDALVQKLGPTRILLLGGLCAAGGFLLAALVPVWSLAVLGFALVGAGASNIVPVLFSAAGRQTAMPGNLAIGAVTTLGYAGILAGPALIGFVAHAITLPAALVAVATMLLGVAASAYRVGK